MKPFKGNQYNKVSTKVYYNYYKDEALPNPSTSERVLTFDSIFEFNVWRLLRKRDGLEVLLHKKVEPLNWVIDFQVSLNQKQKFPKWIDDLGVKPHKGKWFYIDAKGVIDDKTYDRVKGLPKRLQSKIILITPTKIIVQGLNCHILSMAQIGGDVWVKNNQISIPNRVSRKDNLEARANRSPK